MQEILASTEEMRSMLIAEELMLLKEISSFFSLLILLEYVCVPIIKDRCKTGSC